MDVVVSRSLDIIPDDVTVLSYIDHYYHQILACLGYPLNAPPVADLLRSLHGFEGDWLIASPIHWQATHNDAMLVGTGHELALSEEEGLLWFDVFARCFQGDFGAIHYHDPYTWLIRVDGLPTLHAKPAHLLRHQSLMPELAEMDKTMFWQRVLTECQMLFSQHSLNKTRRATHSISGLWVWGSGVLHPKTNRVIVANTNSSQRIAAVLTNHIRRDTLDNIEASALVLDDDLEHLRILEAQTKRQMVHWYWQNAAYKTKPLGWLKQLWCRI